MDEEDKYSSNNNGLLLCITENYFILIWILFWRFFWWTLSFTISSHVRFNLFIRNDRITKQIISISRFPFDWKTPIGYIVAIIFQSILMCITTMNCTCAILFPIAHCVFLITFCFDLQKELRTLNKIIKSKCGENKKRPTNRYIEIKKQLSKIIQFQCEAKELSG